MYRLAYGTVDARLATVKNKNWKPLDNKRDFKKWKQHYDELYRNPVDGTVLEELTVSNKP